MPGRSYAPQHCCWPLTSQPLAAKPSQSPHPELQAPMTHWPALHVAAALAKAHCLPHVPQLLVVLSRLTLQQEGKGGGGSSH